MMKSIRSIKGSATILSLLISAVVITVGIGFNWLVKEHLRAAEGLKNKTESMLKAKSAYDTLIYSILCGTTTSSDVLITEGDGQLGVGRIPLNGKPVSLKGAVTVAIQDSNGMLSLSSLNTPAMERLINIVAPEKNAAPVIIDSYLDWIDQDKLARLNGAEDAYYSREGKPYVPRNYPMQYREEFGLIRGMDKDLYKGLSPHLTMLPNLGFNPNTASDEVLMAYLDIDRDTLEKLRSYMASAPVTNDAALFSITGRTIVNDEGLYFFPDRFWDVTIAAGSPRVMYSIRAGIDLKQSTIAPYAVVYWKEE